jgi:hypothetical protein
MISRGAPVARDGCTARSDNGQVVIDGTGGRGFSTPVLGPALMSDKPLRDTQPAASVRKKVQTDLETCVHWQGVVLYQVRQSRWVPQSRTEVLLLRPRALTVPCAWFFRRLDSLAAGGDAGTIRRCLPPVCPRPRVFCSQGEHVAPLPALYI